jgi:hypothetical protein
MPKSRLPAITLFWRSALEQFQQQESNIVIHQRPFFKLLIDMVAVVQEQVKDMNNIKVATG